MSKTAAILPIARTWRDIPQQVKPRAMSREGKRRSALQGLRVVGGVAALAVTVAAAWEVYSSLQPGLATSSLPAAQALPIGDNVEPVTDGVLDRAWLRRTLALPASATLANIDPAALRPRLLAGGQVKTAEFVRHFPRTLAVHIVERTPVARLMAQTAGGVQKEYLVARDGVVYSGAGYDPQMVKTLLWLDGVHLQLGGPGLATISGMDQAAEFLAQCSILVVQHLTRTWRVISLARLESDGLIEIRTAVDTRIMFDLRQGNPYVQLARLDTVLDRMAGSVPAGAVRVINLALEKPFATIVPAQGWSALYPLRQGFGGQAQRAEPAVDSDAASGPSQRVGTTRSTAPAGIHFHIYP